MKRHLSAALSVIITILFLFAVFAPVESFAVDGEGSGLRKIDESEMDDAVDVSDVEGIAQDKDYNKNMKFRIVDVSLMGEDGFIAIKQTDDFVLIWTVNELGGARQSEIISMLRDFDGSMRDNKSKTITFIFTSGVGRLYPYDDSPITGSAIGLYFVYDGKIYIQENKIGHYDILMGEINTPTPPPTESSNPPAPESSNPPAPESSNPPAPESSNPPAPESNNPPASESSNPPAPESSNPPAPESSNPPAPESSNPPAPESSNPPAPESSNPPAPESSNPPAPESSNPPTTEIPETPTTEIIDIEETMPPLAGPSTNPPTTETTEELTDIEDEDVPMTGDAGMGAALSMGVLSLLGGVYVYKNRKH